MTIRTMSRHPIEISQSVSLGALAVIQLVKGPSPASTNSLIDPWTQTALAWLLIGSAVICLAGIVWPDIPMGLYLEAGGLSGLGFAGAAYTGLIVCVVPHWLSTSGFWFVLSIAIGCLGRSFQIYRSLRHAVVQADRVESGDL